MNIIERLQKMTEILSAVPVEKNNFRPFNPQLEMDLIAEHIKMGKWSLLHFEGKKSGFGTRAMRVVPWLSSKDWPVGGTMPYFESYFGYSTMKDYQVMGILEMLTVSRNYCAKYLENWDAFYEVRFPLFKLFEFEEGIHIIKEWLFNKDNWPNEQLNVEEKNKQLKELSLKFDQSEGNKIQWDLVERYKNDRFLPEIPKEDLGIYEERILSSIADRASFRAFDEPFERLEHLLFQSVCYAHGFGTESCQLKGRPSPAETDSSKVFYPIELLFEEAIHAKPIEKLRSLPEFHILESMNKKRHSYNGIAHMEVAALMDDQYNDPKKSWKYLQAAGYWAGKNMPEAQATVLSAAMHLCKKHGWTEALEVLEYNKQIMQS